MYHSSLSFFHFFATSCTEDYQLPNMGSQTTIVITGMVTNEPGPYYVSVYKYSSNLSTGKAEQQGINDARITITDSNGNVDELQSFYSVPVETEELDNWPYFREYFRIPDEKGGYIRFETISRYDEEIRGGKYFTTSTKGNAGHTYTLKVEYAGKEYVATDEMCYGTVIDSISLEPVGRYIYDKPDGEDGFLVPCIYFAEPQNEKNFYMFNAYSSPLYEYIDIFSEPLKEIVLNLRSLSGYSEWPISVVSDRFLPPYVTNINYPTATANENTLTEPIWDLMIGKEMKLAPSTCIVLQNLFTGIFQSCHDNIIRMAALFPLRQLRRQRI